jgi:hypothetical protein
MIGSPLLVPAHPYEGRDRTRLAPDEIAALGIACPFQHVAPFRAMSVLDSIVTGSASRRYAYGPAHGRPLGTGGPKAATRVVGAKSRHRDVRKGGDVGATGPVAAPAASRARGRVAAQVCMGAAR